MVLRSISFCLFISVSGCATSTLQVQSVPPGAEVTFTARGRAPTVLGKTPLDLNSQNAPGLFAESGEVRVTAEGFAAQSALVPPLGTMGGIGTINFTLAQAELPKICQSNSDLANDVARGVAEVTSLIQRKRYGEADTQIASLIGKFPSVSVLYDLKGNIAYLQRDLVRALDAFKHSNTLAPANPATLKMIDRLQTLQGSK